MFAPGGLLVLGCGRFLCLRRDLRPVELIVKVELSKAGGSKYKPAAWVAGDKTVSVEESIVSEICGLHHVPVVISSLIQFLLHREAYDIVTT